MAIWAIQFTPALTQMTMQPLFEQGNPGSILLHCEPELDFNKSVFSLRCQLPLHTLSSWTSVIFFYPPALEQSLQNR